MPLRAKKPQDIKKRLKLFMYGPAKVGKTTACIQFPNTYLIDTEDGAVNTKYVEILNKNNSAVFQTSDFDEMVKEINALLTEKHDYKTLVIDPLTIVYNDLIEKAEKKVGSEYGRHYGEANKQMKHLMNLLLRLDMNVIITSHSKNEYGKDLCILGQTFDCYKKLDYLFDLILEIKKQGDSRYAYIKGSRLIGFQESATFEFSYEEMTKRHGKEIIEKQSTPEILASKEQVQEINNFIKLLSIPDETIVKWLKKAKANDFYEMNQLDIQKCIDHLKSKITTTNEEH